MKNFTLMLLAVMLTAVMPAANAAPTKRFVHKAKTETKKSPKKATRALSPKADATAALWMPAHETVYTYDLDAGDWTAEIEADLTYDSKGNILTQTETFEGEPTSRTVNTYDSNGNLTSTTSQSYEGTEWVNGEITRYVYDTAVPTFQIDKEIAAWTDGAWSVYYKHRYAITRDNAGNVTRMAIELQYTDTSEWDTLEVFTVTYRDGVADTWTHKDYTSGDPEGYETGLTNIVWKNTDGQILAKSEEELFTGNNRIASATLTDQGETIGSITATYNANDDGFEAKGVAASDPNLYYTYRLEFTDANGSSKFSYTGNLYSEDLSAIVKYEEILYTVMDSHGNCTLEAVEIHDEEFGDMFEATRNEYEYGTRGETLTITESSMFVEEAEFPTTAGEGGVKIPTNGEWEPWMKIVGSNFVNVASVESAIADDIKCSYNGGVLHISTPGTAQCTVTNISGATVLSTQVEGVSTVSVSSLATGLYLVNVRTAGDTLICKIVVK